MDPTGGKLNGVTCIIFQSSIPIERNDFELIDGWIRAMINRSKNSNYVNNFLLCKLLYFLHTYSYIIFVIILKE